jgi:hypothetical protein
MGKIKRIDRNRYLTDEEAARYDTMREEVADRPTKRQAIESGRFIGPMSLEEYFAWRETAGDAPLARQLQEALRACGQPVSEIAKASGADAAVIHRFLSGERGITLNTAGKLAAYLHWTLMPEQAKR